MYLHRMVVYDDQVLAYRIKLVLDNKDTSFSSYIFGC